MADDLARLVASFEVRTAAAERSLAKIQSQTNVSMRAIVRDTTRASADVEKAFRRIDTGSLVAQIQDVGVQLQSGTSPLTILAQQGPQISAALGEGTGIAGALRAIAGAAASMITPLNLAIGALLLFGTTAIVPAISALVASLFNIGDSAEEAAARRLLTRKRCLTSVLFQKKNTIDKFSLRKALMRLPQPQRTLKLFVNTLKRPRPRLTILAKNFKKQSRFLRLIARPI
jgi:hypothetical protein